MWNTASLTHVDNRFPLELNLDSLAGHAIDYYVIYGPGMDQLIHEYRNLTGHTPMLPKWSYGFFQSKDRYVSQEEVLAIAHRYREEHIPLDGIVQDWFWWKAEGDPTFNSSFPDVTGELKQLHDEHVHAMLSVWGLFDSKSQNFQQMTQQHLDVPNAHVYDATNPRARDFYWNNLAGKLFSLGWDAFWLDSAEPEEYWPHMGDAILRDKKISIGSGAEYTNIFPFMHTLGVQEHWKATTDRKRVFLLTRSAFLGQQRVGAAVWSGDVYGSYWGLRHQVAAGLNFALSGYPYTTFTYSNLMLPDAPVNAGDPLHASVTVANTGKVSGDEVVELYLQFPEVSGAPRRSLRGFQRVHLEPGASQKVEFQLNPRDLSMVTDLGDIIVAQGKYTVSIGSGQPGTGVPSVNGNLEIKGQIVLPE